MSLNTNNTPTQETIEQCKEILCDEIKNANSKKIASKIVKQTKKNIKKYKTCCLVKTQDTQTFYDNLNLCVCVPGKKKTSLLTDEIKNTIKKREELAKMLKEAVSNIKKVKGKMSEAQDEACKLNRCWEEEKRCNLDLYNVLKDLDITFGETTYKLYTEDDTDSATKEITRHTKDCYEKITTTFDAGVNIIGIQTFVNVNSLTGISDELSQKIDDFKKDIEGNVKKTEEASKKATEELSACLEAEVAIAFDCCTAQMEYKSCKLTRECICNDDCAGKNSDELDRICKKLKEGVPTTPSGELDCDKLEKEKPVNREKPCDDEWSVS